MLYSSSCVYLLGFTHEEDSFVWNFGFGVNRVVRRVWSRMLTLSLFYVMTPKEKELFSFYLTCTDSGDGYVGFVIDM